MASSASPGVQLQQSQAQQRPVQQHPPSQPQPPPPSQQPQLITTEMIQQYLDENETLITTIVENMNANRLKECTQYQARLQQNLMYLAAIADQSPAPQQQNQT